MDKIDREWLISRGVRLDLREKTPKYSRKEEAEILRELAATPIKFCTRYLGEPESDMIKSIKSLQEFRKNYKSKE